MSTKSIAILVGTGLWRGLSTLELKDKTVHHNTKVDLEHKTVEILYHETGFYKDIRVIILPRHGISMDRPQRSPAELVLSSVHEAHIWFLAQQGVDEIYAFNTVGALDERLPLANTNRFIIPDQMGYGLGAPVHSFGTKATHPHPEMNTPFATELRTKLLTAVSEVDAKAINTGTYIYSNIDHLESKAEGRALQRMFQDAENPVVGSTAGAELVLCKEMGLKYAMLCSVSNYVQGTTDKKVEHCDILKIIESSGHTLVCIVKSLLEINQVQNLEAVCRH